MSTPAIVALTFALVTPAVIAAVATIHITMRRDWNLLAVAGAAVLVLALGIWAASTVLNNMIN